ncbi:biliverdin-producing heme oxygenase [Mucilaginibacter sp. 21P]|uniref:biliverdin-producing heme oxygenase n=1 Tax=Mucilaginibacter sp. 21P TaxID=2778902 RepID=UPI001C55B322|nr:biliverdin-producing heme oxygenase [Mucilaginibacter sp. 21P]QXV66434.1 biliverdin-producing heme oxygenase [Mucilaginibacter sp. 21P]
MLSEKLKEETKQNHQILEKVLVGNLRSIRSKDGYINLLKMFYGYFGGLEKSIEQHVDSNLLPDNDERRKIAFIANDIEALGGLVPAKAEGNDLPRIESHLEALGALYVIEGSTLGGKIISKMMEQQLGLNGNGLSFFSGYGDRTEEMWNIFKEKMDAQAENPEQEAVVIAAANETFSKFGDWFDKQQAAA